MEYNIMQAIKSLQSILVSNIKKIGFLFGAGISCANKNSSMKIPNVLEMTKKIEEEIKKEEKYAQALDKIKTDIKSDMESEKEPNIEEILSNIEGKIKYIGEETLNGLNKEEFIFLRKKTIKQINTMVSVDKNVNENNIKDLVQYKFAKWIANANRETGIEIFTTNYDYLLEMGLEYFNILYYDGFHGSYKPFFNSIGVEDFNYLYKETKLWKIHGSLGMEYDPMYRKIIKNKTNQYDDRKLMIYPSSMKYDNSKKQPYASYMDRLHEFLKQDDAVLVVCGYSFGDEHINERIYSALNTSALTSVIVLLYDENFDINANLYKEAMKNHKITIFSQKHAVIGGKFYDWKSYTKDENYSYIIKKSVKTDEIENNLVDFNCFVDFLLDMAGINEEESNIE